MIKWRNEYTLGIELIDNQHKKLLEIVNRLYSAFIEKKQSEEVLTVLVELADYTKQHFSTEEYYFRKFNYENSDAHMKQHKIFIKKVDEFHAKAKEDSGRYVFSIITFLQEWMNSHFIEADKKYVSCFKKNLLM